MPVIYTLMKDRRRRTYENLFSILIQLIPDLNPEVIIIDYEKSVISAVSEMFPESEPQGCLFHLAQSVIRFMAGIGLRREYEDNQVCRMYVRALMALAYVPISEVRETYLFLKNHPERPRNLDRLYQYFYTNYVGSLAMERNGSVRFPISLWNCRARAEAGLPTTNNSIEGWHSSMKLSFKRKPRSVYSFVGCLKTEEVNSRLKLDAINVLRERPRNNRYQVEKNTLLVYLQEKRGLHGRDYILYLTNFLRYQ